MIVLGFNSSKRSQVVNATTVAGKSAATSAGKKQSKKGRRETLQALTQRDLSYFSSEKFASSLKRIEDKVLKHQWSDIIEDRKAENAWQRGQSIKATLKAEAKSLIFSDILEYHYAPEEHWGRGAVKSLLKGYRSQALKNAEQARSWNKKFYYLLADLLINDQIIDEFLKGINAPIVRDTLRF
jgi:hypothetical protein